MKHGKVFLVLTDLNKCFDKINRSGIIINLSQIGIDGNNIRLLIDELNNSKCNIVYNNIHSELIEINNGAPQGHNESGPIANIYLNPILIKCLQNTKTICYNKNVSAINYSDDGFKLATSLISTQCLVDTEAINLHKINMSSNATKSKIIYYQRNCNLPPPINHYITMNEKQIMISKANNYAKILGFDLDFNSKNFTNYHIQQKIVRFNRLRKRLFYNKLLGDMMNIDIQMSFYSKKIRMAFMYGFRSILINNTNYKKIESVQNKYLYTITNCRIHTNTLSLRILLGIPPIKQFIIKCKLLMYFDIFIKNKNLFTAIITHNYTELYQKYKANNCNIAGIDNQWVFPTIDYINIL